MKYDELKISLENGNLKLPKFQREFVWSLEKSASLLDSILKGYPIGAFILWKSKDNLRAIKNLGDITFPSKPEGEEVEYVLDGQQRLTSLYACFEGKKVNRKGTRTPLDFSKIWVRLSDVDADDGEIVTAKLGKDTENYITVTDLLGGYSVWKTYPERHHAKIADFEKQLYRYEYTVIPLPKATSIDVAAEIFARINVGGKPLSVFEIMVAKTYADDKFDLSEAYAKLIDELEPRGYGKLNDQVVLIAAAMIICGKGRKKDILAINRENFIAHWADVVKAIKLAIEYFQKEYSVAVLDVLPYQQLIVPFAYFFYMHKKQPAGKTKQCLKDFFWMCAFSSRYMDGLNSSLALDIKRMKAIIDGKQPEFNWRIDASAEHIDVIGKFTLGKKSHYIKAILCVLASFDPLSFKTNIAVALSEALTKSAARNYHHFFPKAYLRGGVNVREINHIANITILDAETNQEIGARKPSDYMAEFKAINSSITETMDTHLIGDFDKFGITDDDYDKFFNARLELISAEIKNRIPK